MTKPAHEILIGDVREKLRGLPDGIARTCVTSPPYWGLRDYGCEGQIGMEPTPELWCSTLVEVCREIRRCLTDDGTLWLNVGDCYNAGGRGGNPNGPTSTLQGGTESQEQSRVRRHKLKPSNGAAVAETLKPKDLIGLPWRLAFALQADGWWLRSAAPWVKRTAMPESCTDRPSSALEYMFLLSKSGRATHWVHRDLPYARRVYERPRPDYRWINKKTRQESKTQRDSDDWYRVNLWRGRDYYFDGDAVKRAGSIDTHARYARGRSDSHKWADGGPGDQSIARSFEHMVKVPSGWDQAPGHHSRSHREGRAPGVNPKAASIDPGDHHGRPKQNGSFSAAVVGPVATRNIRNTDWWFDSVGMLLAGEEVVGFDVCTQAFREAHFATYPEKLVEPCILAGSAEGDTVLDPFGGSGTTAVVALRHKRRAILCELNPEYAAMAERRIRASLKPQTFRDESKVGHAPLFAQGGGGGQHE